LHPGVNLSVDHVVPSRAVGVLEVGHEGRRPAIQGVDDHLAIGRAGNLDAAVEQVSGCAAIVHSDSRIFRVSGRKSGSLPASKLMLACSAFGQQLLATRLELTVQLGDQRERRLG
jgi:hypothetical protein